MCVCGCLYVHVCMYVWVFVNVCIICVWVFGCGCVYVCVHNLFFQISEGMYALFLMILQYITEQKAQLRVQET